MPEQAERWTMSSAEGSFHSCSETPLHPTQVTTQRQSYDSVVNKNGKQTLHLCKGLGLYIVNGRTRGDSLGRYTYSSGLGSSVVDYAITDMDPEHINAFIVMPQTPLSDHSQVTLYLNKTEPAQKDHQPTARLFNLESAYRWGQNSTAEYQAALDSAEIEAMLDHFQQTQYPSSNEGLNLATKHLNQYIC